MEKNLCTRCGWVEAKRDNLCTHCWTLLGIQELHRAIHSLDEARQEATAEERLAVLEDFERRLDALELVAANVEIR